MEEFPSNSRTVRVERTERTTRVNPVQAEPEKEVMKVVTDGSAVKRKVGMWGRVKKTFFGADLNHVVSYVGNDVLRPAFQDMVADAVTTGVERMIFGEARVGGGSRRRTGGGASTNFVNYRGYSGDPRGSGPARREDPRPQLSRQARRSHDFGEIVLGSRAQANDVLDQMFALLDKYGVVSVKDLLVMVDIAPEFTDEKWGWDSLAGADARRTRDGYLLVLPPTEPIV